MKINSWILLALIFFLIGISFGQSAEKAPLSEADQFMLKSAGYTDEQIAENGQQLLFQVLSAGDDEDEDEDDEDDDDELMIPPLEEDGTFSVQSKELLKAQGLTPEQIIQYEQQLQQQLAQQQAQEEPPQLGPDGNLSVEDKEKLAQQGYAEADILNYEKQLQMMAVQPVLGENDSIPPAVIEALLFQGYTKEDIAKVEKSLQKAAGFQPVGSVPLNKDRTLTFDYELNPYFSFAGFGKMFTAPVVLDAGEEEGVYGYLFNNFFFPKFVTLQFSANPFPNIGATIKQNHTGKKGYDNSWYGPIVTAVTAGFPDAGAISLFLGNRVFSGIKETGAITGQGFGGLLVNYGPIHIVNSIYVMDHWLELETKLKGADLSEKKQISFSFRVGGKVHSHDEINNTIFVSFKRDRTDKDNSDILSLKNSDQEFRIDVLAENALKPTQLTFVFGKKMPIFDGDYIFSLSLGVLKVFTTGYEGSLKEEVQGTGWTFVFRPNVLF